VNVVIMTGSTLVPKLGLRRNRAGTDDCGATMILGEATPALRDTQQIKEFG
jgi:hypothetical protein